MPSSRPMPEEIKAGFYPDFERGWHRAELFGRAVMLVVVAATLVGLAGGGPVSLWTRTVVSDALEVEYAPVVRFGTPTGLTVRIPVSPGQSRTALTVPGNLVDRYGLQSINPTPVEVQGGPDRSMRLVFPAQPGAQSIAVQIGGMPSSGGRMSLSVRTDDGAATAWSQLILP